MDTTKAIEDLRNLKIPKYHRIWKPFMKKYNCQKIAEIGIFDGKNFELLIEHGPKVAVAVDAWVNDGIASHNDTGYSQDVLDKMYRNFKQKMANKPFVRICREYSTNAVKRFANEYFDFVYIDADHTYKGCLTDIENWYLKVKKGKFLAGDDYRHGVTSRTKVKIGVIEAVNQFAETNKLRVYEIPGHGWVIIK